MRRQYDRRLLLFAIVACLAGLICAIVGQPLVHGSDSAVSTLVSVYSILAGFLIAAMAIVGEPLLIPFGSWRTQELGRPTVRARLSKMQYLFLFYMVVLLFVFLTQLQPKSRDGSPQTLTIWFERIYLFFATVSFIYSLWLPSILKRIQLDRLDAFIEHRKENQPNSKPE